MKTFAIIALSFAIIGISILSVETFTNGVDVTDVTVDPQTFIVQVRSKYQQAKLNSSGIVLSDRWILAVGSMIHKDGVLGFSAAIFIYTKAAIFNGLTDVYHGERRVFSGRLAMVKTNRTFALSATFKVAPLPATPNDLFTGSVASLTGYGPVDDTSQFSKVRKTLNGFVIDDSAKYDGVNPDETVVSAGTTASCVDNYDIGSVVYVDTPTVAVVSLILENYAKGTCTDYPDQNVFISLSVRTVLDAIKATIVT